MERAQPIPGPSIPRKSLLALFNRFLGFGLVVWGGPVAQIGMQTSRSGHPVSSSWVVEDATFRTRGGQEPEPRFQLARRWQG